jgi:hypothetical protein
MWMKLKALVRKYLSTAQGTRVATGILCVLLVAILNQKLGFVRYLDYLKEINLDAWLEGLASTPSPRIVLVTIDAADYLAYFGERSPLKPDIVADVVKLAFDGGASVVGVDIDTADWPDKFRAEHLSSYASRIVWAGDPPAKALTAPGSMPWIFADPALQQSKAENPKMRNETGIARTHPRLDGISFSDAIVCMFDPHNEICGEQEKRTEGEYIRFLSRRPCSDCFMEPDIQTLTLTMLKDARGSGRREWSARQPFKDMIVLIGGTAPKLKDYHATPFGRSSGVGIHADLISSRLLGPLVSVSKWAEFWIDFLCGVFVVAVEELIRHWAARRSSKAGHLVSEFAFLPAMLIGTLSITVLSYWLFRIGQTYFSCLVVIGSLFVHDWWASHVELASESGRHPHTKEAGAS